MPTDCRPNRNGECRTCKDRCQPKGPYNLAGWSAGGIAAFHAALVLTEQSEKVDCLILIDAPNPMGIKKLPSRYYKYLETAGVFGIKTAP